MVKQAGLLMMALLLSAPAFAGHPESVPPAPKADPALLEFIGSWQSSDGKWVDPMTFVRVNPEKLAGEKSRRAGTPAPASAKLPPPNLARAEQRS